jgi:predicted TIM-barrel fold metal-dependent hydrolase
MSKLWNHGWAAFACAAALSAPAFAASKTYLGMPVEPIDIHMHPGTYQTMGPKGQAFVKAALPEFLPDFLKGLSLSTVGNMMLDPYGAFIGIKNECEKSGMKMCGLFAIYAPETWGVASNEYVLEKLQNGKNKKADGKPMFFGLASVRMQNWNMAETTELDNLKKALQQKWFRGIKLAFIHNSIPLDDPQYDSIYGVAAEFDVPVYHHVGSSPLQKLADFGDEEDQKEYISSYDPSRLEATIAAHPKVKFVLGHMGFDFNKEGYDFSQVVYDLAERYPNVYLEISAFGRAAYDPEGKNMDLALNTIKTKGLLDRAIYGSDGPGSPGGTEKYLDAVLKSMERVGYSYAEAEAVLNKNTARIFKLDDML